MKSEDLGRRMKRVWQRNLLPKDGRPEERGRVMEARSPRRPGETGVKWRETIERQMRDACHCVLRTTGQNASWDTSANDEGAILAGKLFLCLHLWPNLHGLRSVRSEYIFFKVPLKIEECILQSCDIHFQLEHNESFTMRPNLSDGKDIKGEIQFILEFYRLEEN